jgi:hypothetical protein
VPCWWQDLERGREDYPPASRLGGSAGPADICKADQTGSWLIEGEEIMGWKVRGTDSGGAKLQKDGRDIELPLYARRRTHILSRSTKSLACWRSEPYQVASNIPSNCRIMGAPDVNHDYFAVAAPVVYKMATGMTLYASSVDKPLRLSRRRAGGTMLETGLHSSRTSLARSPKKRNCLGKVGRNDSALSSCDTRAFLD